MMTELTISLMVNPKTLFPLILFHLSGAPGAANPILLLKRAPPCASLMLLTTVVPPTPLTTPTYMSFLRLLSRILTSHSLLGLSHPLLHLSVISQICTFSNTSYECHTLLVTCQRTFPPRFFISDLSRNHTGHLTKMVIQVTTFFCLITTIPS